MLFFIGNFTLVQSLDYETQNKYSFIISATFADGTVAQADVEVIVEDVNDNCPRFNSTEITVFHTEPIAKDVLVAITSMIDVDTVGTITYTLTGNSQFSIDSKGRIFANTVINDNVRRIPEKEYDLTASVFDGRCSASTKIKVKTTKVLVDLYQFDEPFYVYRIGEEQSIPFTINVFNNKGGFMDATYHLVDDSPTFKVNASTGQYSFLIVFLISISKKIFSVDIEFLIMGDV